MSKIHNPTLDVLNNRVSTRKFTQKPLTQDEKDAIVNAAFRAPTAGNLMMYSIIEVEDQKLKDSLAVTCDHQAFIATAPYVLLFVADYQKWVDLYRCGQVEKLDVQHRDPAEGEMLLACADALIAAQNAVIAAESMGIGSCYIGDILENGEEHARLFDLPLYTLPIALLVFGRPAFQRALRERQSRYVLQKDKYHRLTDEQLREVVDALDETFAPHGFKPGIANYPQYLYRQKHASDFMREMARSVRWWIGRWVS